MFESLETGAGLDVVLWLQDLRIAPLEWLAVGLHYMGDDLFFLLVLPLVYWSINRALGVRMMFALALTINAAEGLKLLLRAPRPPDVSPLVEPLVDAYTYGFPSGHVAVAVGFWGYLAWWIGTRRAVTLVGIYVALMMWARMYVGVHYPQDVIGGLIVGLGALALFIWLEDGIPEIWAKLPDRAQVSIVVLMGIVGMTYLFDSPDGMAMVGALVGVLAGLMIDDRWIGFSAAGTQRQRTLRYVTGAALLLALYVGLKLAVGLLADEDTTAYALLRGVRYAVVGAFGVAGWPYLAARCGLAPMSAAAPDAQAVDATG